jgi:hypothetical protein
MTSATRTRQPNEMFAERAAGSAPGSAVSTTKKRRELFRDYLVQGLVAAWMNALIVAVVVIAVVTAVFLPSGQWPDQSTWAIGALKLFALWCLAFLPGWLYIRFLRLRALALWNEYVLVLHRLGWDLPWNLPRPPTDSPFFAAWNSGVHHRPQLNIYRQKFEAYYGRSIPDRVESSHKDPDDLVDFRVRRESLFPIFLCTTVFAVGWTACLWDTGFVTTTTPSVWEVMKFAFMGAYLFVLSMLVRRFFQSDLKPSTYASAVVRFVVVLLVVATVHQALPDAFLRPGAEIALAFMVGFFPLVGLQLLHRAVAGLFGWALPPLTSDHPLDALDGLNLWYEARLFEEGVEDMQNLATMNLVEVVLHTRVPTGRLIDWIDQAHLLLALGPLAERQADRVDRPDQPPFGNEWFCGADARDRLQRAGIRRATDLLRAYSNIVGLPAGERPAFTRPTKPDSLPLPAAQLALLVSVLGVEEGLVPVWNWTHRGGPSWQTLDAHPVGPGPGAPGPKVWCAAPKGAPGERN